MLQSLDTLIERLDHLLSDLAAAEVAHADRIAAVTPGHHRGAVNLVHYTVLRGQELRALQNDLMDLGATSLSTTEAHVRAKVRAARTVLAALRGDRGPWELDAVNAALDAGDAILERNTTALFGPARPQRATRIMVTLPADAASSPDLVAGLVEAGMDVARVNCAHDDPAAWSAMVTRTRRAARDTGRPVAVSMDLPGPKLRTGPIADGPRIARTRVTRDPTGVVTVPARIWLTSTTAPTPRPPLPGGRGRAALVVCVDPLWLAARAPGDQVTLTDVRGRNRSFRVTTITAGGALAEGDRGAYLGEGTKLTCDGEITLVTGIPPLRQRLSLARGDLLVLTADLTPVQPPEPGQIPRIGCTLPQALTAARRGDLIAFDDGAIEAIVETPATPGAREITVRVTRTRPGGHHLGAEKGINLPDTQLAVTALTADDDARLPFIVAHADLVAISFIRSAADVEHVLDRLHAHGGEHLGIIVKIETRQGFANLPSILLAGMRHPRLGVMIARGDLAVEVGYERLSEIPRQVLALCEAAHIPVIWATQVLENLAQTGQPSRAEITDAAAAQRAECVMLNKGPHIVETITALDDILTRMSHTQRKSRTLMRHIHSWDGQ